MGELTISIFQGEGFVKHFDTVKIYSAADDVDLKNAAIHASFEEKSRNMLPLISGKY